MNEKTGFRETSASIILFSLSPAMLYLTAYLCGRLNAGAWINYIINSAFVFGLILVSRRYFVRFDSDIIDSAASVCGQAMSKLTGFVYLILIFLYTAINFGLYTESISGLGLFEHSAEYISVVPVVAAVICAYSGMEGNTRFAYAIFFVAFLITFFCIISTHKAWDVQNIFPVLGTSTRATFFNTGSVAAYPGLAAVFLVNRYISDKSDAGRCLWRCFGGVFLFGILLTAIYTLSVPFPTNTNFMFTSEGVLSSTLSGELFHRFEIFLVSLNIIFDISATSFGILLCAVTVAKLTGEKDFRPFVLILGLIVFYMGFFVISPEIYVGFCTIMTVIVFLIPIALSIASDLKRKERDGIS